MPRTGFGRKLKDRTTRRKMSELELGWLIGILDGEGCFYANKRGKQAQIKVAMTDEDTILRLAEITGEGTVTGPKPRPAPHKPVWTWQVTDHGGVARLALACVPFLSERRQGQVAAMSSALGPMKVSPCGTNNACKAHRARGEKPCAACLEAEGAHYRKWKAKTNYNAKRRSDYRRGKQTMDQGSLSV